MNETTDTGVDYPEIEIGDKKYAIKFTRGTLYRLDKAGIVFNPSFAKGGASVQLSNLMDTLKIVIGFEGTAEELTELAFDQKDEITQALVDAWGKVALPAIQKRIAALRLAAAQKEAQPVIQ